MACETAITTGMVLVMGEITTNAYIDMQQVVREQSKKLVMTMETMDLMHIPVPS